MDLDAFAASTASSKAAGQKTSGRMRAGGINAVMLGEREARGKSIHLAKKTLDLSRNGFPFPRGVPPLAGNDRNFHLNEFHSTGGVAPSGAFRLPWNRFS
jgi:hypothetical protein